MRAASSFAQALTSYRPAVRALTFVIGLTIATASGQAQTTQQGPVTLGWVKSTANLLAFIVPKIGEKHGLKIESINFNTAVDISTAMVSGQIDVGVLTPIHLIRAIENKIDFVQIAGNARGNTGIVVSKKLNLKENDWAGLKKILSEKKLKVASSRGSINELLAIAELSKHGIDVEKDIDLINVANFGQHPQALRSGDFDMIITLEPLSSLAILEGTGTLFTRPYGTAAGDLNTNYVVQRSWLAQNADKAQAFVGALKEASQVLSSDKERELKAAVQLTGMKPDILSAALANNRYDLGNGLPEMEELARLAFERHYSTRNVAPELKQHVDDRFLNAATAGR